jgi:hypothetical protein
LTIIPTLSLQGETSKAHNEGEIMSIRKLLRGASLALLLLAVLPPSAFAQSDGGVPLPPATPGSDVPGPGSLLGAATLVPGPQQQSPAASTDAAVPSPFGGFSPFMNPKVGQAPLRADYRVTWFPDEHVAAQVANLGYVQQDLTIAVPIWQDCTDEVTGSVHVRNETFHTLAVLPDTGQPFPQDLWNVRFGLNYRHLFDNGWIAGGGVSLGSASDQPFHSINEMTVGLNAFLRIPQGEHNAWLFSLAYSPTGELGFPIPGVAYVWQPSDQFRMNIGLPFQLVYRPIEDLTFDCSYMLLRTIHARATYRVCPPVRVYLAYDWSNEGYFLADRPDVNDRFFYYDQRLTTGVQANVGKHVLLDLAGGYVFDRYYFQGQHFSDSDTNRIDVGSGPFVSFQVQVRW